MVYGRIFGGSSLCKARVTQVCSHNKEEYQGSRIPTFLGEHLCKSCHVARRKDDRNSLKQGHSLKRGDQTPIVNRPRVESHYLGNPDARSYNTGDKYTHGIGLKVFHHADETSFVG